MEAFLPCYQTTLRNQIKSNIILVDDIFISHSSFVWGELNNEHTRVHALCNNLIILSLSNTLVLEAVTANVFTGLCDVLISYGRCLNCECYKWRFVYERYFGCKTLNIKFTVHASKTWVIFKICLFSPETTTLLTSIWLLRFITACTHYFGCERVYLISLRVPVHVSIRMCVRK